MLEHIRMGQLYWFCNACSFEMPIRSFGDRNAPGTAQTGGVATRPMSQTAA